mmetsp:Transcript_59364/g.141532  ORF Transcript_59364/g.141532 Transcript_59364/m.141532 type:complete len:277 (-) Transcript_59364:92-922(-)
MRSLRRRASLSSLLLSAVFFVALSGPWLTCFQEPVGTNFEQRQARRAPLSSSRVQISSAALPTPNGAGGAASQEEECGGGTGRRQFGAVLAAVLALGAATRAARAEEEQLMPFEKSMDSLPPELRKRRTRYPGFSLSSSGLQLKDVVDGRVDAKQPAPGDTVVLNWEGFTINYFGRPFETRTLNQVSKVEQDPMRFKVGDGTVIPAIDEAVRGMREGGVRQLIIPVELGYDEAKKLQPRPSTFSGQRALDFVLDNKGGMMDKTLLINISLKRVYTD